MNNLTSSENFPLPKHNMFFTDITKQINSEAECEIIWNIYNVFLKRSAKSPEKKVFYAYNTFRESLRDNSFTKFVLLKDHSIIGFCIITDNPKKSAFAYPNINSLKDKHPVYFENNKIYYITAICIDPKEPDQRCVYNLIGTMFHFLNNKNAIFALDFPDNLISNNIKTVFNEYNNIKVKDKIIFSITGATGLLGRNLVFEIIKQNINNLHNIKIFFFSRRSDFYSVSERIKNIVLSDGIHYMNIKSNDHNTINNIFKILQPIEIDFNETGMGISQSDLSLLKNQEIDYFFHLAALSDFRKDNRTREDLYKINVDGTNHLLNLINKLTVKEIIFSGSAYSCGTETGIINPNSMVNSNNFRNYYEETKYISEMNFRNFAIQKNIPFKVFRIVGICGRLLEKPLGSISKYDLFYGWAEFFFRLKLKFTNNFDNFYNTPIQIPIRIACNKHSGLNIVPADYAAKIIYYTTLFGSKHSSFHLANEIEIPHRVYLKNILDHLNIYGFSFVDEEPIDKNKFEILYYKSVGKAFAPYLNLTDTKFDTSSLNEIINKVNIYCPEIDADKFNHLINYAKSRNFGYNRIKQ